MQSIDAPLIILVATWIVALLAVAGAKVAAQSKKLLDTPNHRSSHSSTTSKAGGLAIFFSWAAGLFVIAAFSGNAEIGGLAGALGLLGALALALGAADDRWSPSPILKFAGQAAVAALFTMIIGPLETAPLPFFGFARSWRSRSVHNGFLDHCFYERV